MTTDKWTLLVTTLYLVATVLIWLQMVKSNKHAEETRKESADATKESLSLTRDSLAATQKAADAARLDQRPWIGIRGVMNTRFGELYSTESRSGPLMTTDLVVFNSGKTPALDIDICSEIQVISSAMRARVQPLSDDARFNEVCPPIDIIKDTITLIRPQSGMTPEKRRFVGNVYPGQEVNVTVYGAGISQMGFEEDEIKRIGRDELRLFITSRISYRDIFGETHKTTFCARFDPTTNKLKPTAFGNSAD